MLGMAEGRVAISCGVVEGVAATVGVVTTEDPVDEPIFDVNADPLEAFAETGPPPFKVLPGCSPAAARCALMLLCGDGEIWCSD